MRNNIDLTTIGGRIKVKRIEAGLTQEQLAELIPVKSSMICVYEKNNANYSIGTLQALARALDTSVTYLADGVEVEITEEEKVVLSIFNSLKNDATKEVALEQLKLLASL